MIPSKPRKNYVLLRPLSNERSPLPFHVRSVGRQLGDVDFSTRDVAHDFFELVWTTDGEGELVCENRHFPLPPGSVIILFPKQKRYYHSVSERWRFRWFTLIGELAGDVLRSMGAEPVTARVAGRCPEHIFNRLEGLTREISADASRESCQLAFQVMLRATSSVSEKSTVVSGFVQRVMTLINDRLSDPELNVDWLAERLRVHRSVLSRQFKNETGVAPSEYVIQARLRQAMDLLRDGAKVADAARACGIVNPNYFIRLFHQKTGLTPGAFKREQRI